MDPVSPFLGPILQHEQYFICLRPGGGAAHSKHKHQDARDKLRVVEHSKQYGVRRVAENFEVSASSIGGGRGWESQEA